MITRQRMDDQNIRTFNDAMENTPGITAQRWDNDRVEFMSRGFKLTEFRFDGVPVDVEGAGDHGLSTVDMAIYDRVEVTKGASGLLQGAGSRARPLISFASGRRKSFRARFPVSPARGITIAQILISPAPSIRPARCAGVLPVPCSTEIPISIIITNDVRCSLE